MNTLTSRFSVLRLFPLSVFLLLLSCTTGPDLSDGGLSGFEIVWRVPTIGLSVASPTADDERVFIAIKDTLIALDLETGEAVWRAPVGFFISTREMPVVDGVVYLQGRREVVTYDAATGIPSWRTPLDTGRRGFGGSSAAEVGRSRVYAATSEGVHALDRSTGLPLWFTPVEPAPSRMREIGDLLCVGSTNEGSFLAVPQGAITCLSTTDGQIVWRFVVPDFVDGVRTCTSGGGVFGQPAVQDQRLIFGDMCGFLFALDLLTGQPVWQRFLPTAFDTTVLIEGDIAYTCTRSSTCFAFRVSDGTTIWEVEVRGAVSFEDPTLTDNALYVTDIGGFLYKIDKNRGRILWTLRANELEGLFRRRPIVRNGIIYTGGGHFFYAIRKR